MNTSDAAARFNLYLGRSFLSERTCEEIIRNVAHTQPSVAPVYGRGNSATVDERVRKVTLLTPPRDTVALVAERLSALIDSVGQHFRITLNSCEEPQFLRYEPGDFFVAHQDGNTGMLLTNREQSRKVSLVVFLNRQSDSSEPGTYKGGSLLFSDWHPARQPAQFALHGDAGLLVAFPSETTHEVTPITEGERYSIVSWFG